MTTNRRLYLPDLDRLHSGLHAPPDEPYREHGTVLTLTLRHGPPGPAQSSTMMRDHDKPVATIKDYHLPIELGEGLGIGSGQAGLGVGLGIPGVSIRAGGWQLEGTAMSDVKKVKEKRSDRVVKSGLDREGRATMLEVICQDMRELQEAGGYIVKERGSGAETLRRRILASEFRLKGCKVGHSFLPRLPEVQFLPTVDTPDAIADAVVGGKTQVEKEAVTAAVAGAFPASASGEAGNPGAGTAAATPATAAAKKPAGRAPQREARSVIYPLRTVHDPEVIVARQANTGTRALRLVGSEAEERDTSGLASARARLQSGAPPVLPSSEEEWEHMNVIDRINQLNHNTELDPKYQVRTARASFDALQLRMREGLQDSLDRQDYERPSTYRRKFEALTTVMTDNNVVDLARERLEYMRLTAEQKKLQHVIETYKKSNWFHRFLRSVTRDGRAISPGEQHVINHVKRILEAGRSLDHRIFYGIVISCPPDYYKQDEVQVIFTWIRDELGISKTEYREFLEKHSLPVPLHLKRKDPRLDLAAAKVTGTAAARKNQQAAVLKALFPTGAAGGAGSGPTAAAPEAAGAGAAAAVEGPAPEATESPANAEANPSSTSTSTSTSTSAAAAAAPTTAPSATTSTSADAPAAASADTITFRTISEAAPTRDLMSLEDKKRRDAPGPPSSSSSAPAQPATDDKNAAGEQISAVNPLLKRNMQRRDSFLKTNALAATLERRDSISLTIKDPKDSPKVKPRTIFDL